MIIEQPTDLAELSNLPIDTHEIEMKIRKFYNVLDFDFDEDVKPLCFDAKVYLDSSRVLVRGLIIPETNPYFENDDIKKTFFWSLDNLGRIDRNFSLMEEEFDKLEVKEAFQSRNLPNNTLIRTYVNSLVKCMEHLVYYPLIKAWKKFKELPEEDKSEDLFCYFVFVELYHSSESLGSISAEKTKSTPKQQEISFSKATHEGVEITQPTTSPPEIPEEIKGKQEEETENKSEDFIEEMEFLDEEEDEPI